MRNKDFAAFILSHERADHVQTYKTLRRCGYKGVIYIVIDDEDSERDKYIRNFGEGNVIVFNKAERAKVTDTRDNFPERNTVLYARNECFAIAKRLGLRYFLELDDDYSYFRYRFIDNVFCSGTTKRLDEIFDLYLDFLRQTGAKTVTFAQGGDYLGGVNGEAKKIFVKRKAMNSFFCDVENPFQFQGRMNDDVNTYMTLGKKGDLFFQPNIFALDQAATQQNKGGLTDMYLKYGTYVKSMYTLLDCPSCVKITMMGIVNPRLHHRTDWNKAVPKIVSQSYCKNHDQTTK